MAGPWPRIRTRDVVAFVLFFLAAALLQYNSGGYSGEFSASPDEAAHFVTGMMAGDYLTSGFAEPPLQYAENYYRHYPRIAIGHFPPGFYAVQSAWNLIFPPSRISIMLLLAVISALLAACVYYLVAARFTFWAGIAAAVLWLSLPHNQVLGRMVMSDILVALAALLATLAWFRYLETGRAAYSIAFGVLASFAILTKGTAIALAFIPPLSTLLAGKYRSATRWSFWLPALIVALLCGPWYLYAPAAQHDMPDFVSGGEDLGFPLLVLERLDRLHFTLHDNFGTVGILLLIAGIFVKVVSPLLRRRPVEVLWACLAPLALAITLLGIPFGPASASRHVSLSLPAYTIFLAAGVAALCSLRPVQRINQGLLTAVVAAGATALVASNVVSIHPVEVRGYSAAAESILSDPAYSDSVILVSSDGRGEGAMVAEVARRDPDRPGRVVLRASRVLCDDSFTGARYEIRYETTDELSAALRKIPVEFVIVDHAAREIYPHQELLSQLFARSPDSWQQIAQYTDSRGRPSLEVFRQVDLPAPRVTHIRLSEVPGMESILSN